ncbi:MAG: hypothetical protein HYX39_03180 [Bacteroidetes bacterium]|nr:hypothetical protein [Bacteroidota bacterium]
MNKILFATALILGLTVTLQAQKTTPSIQKEKQQQAPMTPEERAKKNVKWAEKELGLNSDQKSKWEAAALERINANAPLHEKIKGSTTPEERKAIHAQAKINNEKFNTSVEAFLTPDQKAKWTQAKEKRKQNQKDKRKDNIIDEQD